MSDSFDWSTICFRIGEKVSAYQILDRVAEVAIEEPKRIRMSGYLWKQ